MKILYELSWLWETLGIALLAAAVCVACAALIGRDDDLYDEWEGESIHFFDNICDYGEAPGRYDRIGAAGWVEILENLDSHFVTADE